MSCAEVFKVVRPFPGIQGLGPGPELTGQQGQRRLCRSPALPDSFSPPLLGREQECAGTADRGLVFISHPRGKGLESRFFFSPFLSQGLRIWAKLDPQQEAGRGGKGSTWNDEGDYFRCDPDWETRSGEAGPVPTAIRQGQEVMQCGDGAGALDVSVPLGRGRAGCCISQLGRNQFNGPFKMCIKILRIPHFNIKYS